MILGRPRRRVCIAVLAALAAVSGACAQGSVLSDAAPPTSPPSTPSTSTSTTSTSTTSTSTSTSTSTTTSTTTTTIPLEPGAVAVRTESGILALWYGTADGDRMLVGTPCDRRAAIPAAPVVRDIDVLLDPGHGGLDPGAIASTGMTEAELNLDVSLRVAQILRAAGRTVELTRDDDYFRTIADRAQLANAIAPRAFVSVHHNSGIDAPSRAGIGSEIYHQVGVDESRRLGGLVYQSLEAELAAFDVSWTRGGHFGVRSRANSGGTDFYGVLRRAPGVPSVLVEGAYLSSRAEAALLGTVEFRDAEARAIAGGILRWLTTDEPGSGFQRGFVEDGEGGNTDLSACVDPRLVR